MPEFYFNKYVMRKKTGHPGMTDYGVISTREGLTEMARALLAKLEQPVLNIPFEPHEGHTLTMLWSDYATIARGETSRVYLSFYLTEDLSPYHARQGRLKTILYLTSGLLMLAIFALAVIGAIAIVKGQVG